MLKNNLGGILEEMQAGQACTFQQVDPDREDQTAGLAYRGNFVAAAAAAQNCLS